MAAFPSGTNTLFNQTNAPTGWTKSTTNTDYTLRIVSGSTGGTFTNTLGFSTAMVNTAWTGTISTVNSSVAGSLADLPAHTHTYTTAIGPQSYAYSFQQYSGGTPAPFFYTAQQPSAPGYAAVSGPGGGGITHTHTLTIGSTSFSGSGTALLNVQYVDFILASKD